MDDATPLIAFCVMMLGAFALIGFLAWVQRDKNDPGS